MSESTRNVSFITTALPYVNSVPHLGFALELVLADAHARHLRAQGKHVRFQTGSDENSLKNVQAAEAEGVETRVLVDRNAARFEALNGAMKLSAEAFVRTSAEPGHALGAQKLWRRCVASGDIYLKHYTGLYCVGCEVFYAPGELENGLCPDHGTKPEEIGEQNYFFRLSKYADRLIELIESDTLRIEPEVRKNEILSFIRMGLEDFSVSRSTERARGWGIPVPDDPGQVMYVWFDALTSYITGLGYADESELFRTYWLESQERIHVIGKGITRFHTLYWPAMLISGGLPLPTNVYVHGYITLEGKKISKSLGNVIDPFEVCEKYGVEPIRYFLLRHVRSTDDGDFSVARFVTAYNADLADRLGNLLNRTLSMIDRYFEGRVPAPALDPDAKLLDTASSLTTAIPRAMAAFHPHDALTALWRLVDGANRYVEESTPWALDKQRKKATSDAERTAATDKLATALYGLAEALRLIAHHLTPFMPEASAEMRKQLGLDGPETRAHDAASRWGGLPPGTQLGPRKVLFPKIEIEAPAA